MLVMRRIGDEGPAFFSLSLSYSLTGVGQQLPARYCPARGEISASLSESARRAPVNGIWPPGAAQEGGRKLGPVPRSL